MKSLNKVLLLAGVAAASVSTTSAMAMSSDCYVGANVGALWAHEDRLWTTEDGVPIGFSAPRAPVSASGVAYGGQIGCNYQFSNDWFVGARVLWDGASVSGSAHDPLPNFGNSNTQFDHTRISSFGTLTARLGYLVTPTFNVYVVGGGAMVQERYSVSDTLLGGTFVSSNKSPFGYDVGAGASWMFAQSWDVWAEYDHMGFGSHTDNMAAPFATTLGVVEKQDADKILVGVDYHL